MTWVRKGALLLVAALAVVFLLAAALDSGVVRVVGSPEPIKRTLADSGIYKSIIPSTLEEVAQDSTSAGEIPFSNPLVVSAAEATFSGQYLQTTTDEVIDSIYRWLDGQGTAPDFKIDLAAKKEEFAKQVAAGVKKRVDTLPVCTKISTADFNTFSAKCRPQGITSAAAASEVRKNILKSTEFLNDEVITASDIKTANVCPGPETECPNSTSQPFFTKNNQVPKVFQKLKTAPLVLAVLAVISLVGVLLLSSSRLLGLKHVGFILIGAGIFVLLFGLAVDQAVDNKVLSQISLDNAVLQQNLRDLVADITQRTTNTYLAIGGMYAMLGTAAAAAYYILRRRKV